MARKIPDPIDVHVGARVRMRRLMLNMSQQRLGEKIDLTFQQIQKYEKGTNRISASRLQRFSEVLHVPISFFFDGLPVSGESQKNAAPDYVREFMTSSDGLALTKAFRQIKSDTLRRSIVTLVEQIAN